MKFENCIKTEFLEIKNRQAYITKVIFHGELEGLAPIYFTNFIEFDKFKKSVNLSSLREQLADKELLDYA